ncbi:MAG: OmpA family protein [Acidobacteria bacterium]|nr:OmpA family protein [Acidobacteriota bacterium]
MTHRIVAIVGIAVLAAVFGQGCATKKFVRKTIDERVTPLEGRTAELEESVRRTTTEIAELDKRLSDRITTVDVKVEKTTQLANQADQKASQAITKSTQVAADLNQVRTNLDDFQLLRTASVYFKTNQYNLSPESKAELDAIASLAKQKKGVRIEIAGFADKRGSINHNNQLTNRRADEVKRYLFNVHNIELWRIQQVGAGEINEGDYTREALQQNRRVDVRVIENMVVSKALNGSETASK